MKHSGLKFRAAYARPQHSLLALAVASAVVSFSLPATAQTAGADSIAMGSGSLAAGTNSTAIGTNARVVPTDDVGSIAIGFGARIAPYGGGATSGNIALGTNAGVGAADNAIAIGTGSLSERSNGVAIGTSSHNSFAGIAIGANASTGVDGQIAIGNGAIADPSAGTPGGVAVGQGSYTGGDGAALGLNAHASGQAVAIGPGAYTGYRDVAIGSRATATGDMSVAIGHGSNDNGRDNVFSVGAIGNTRSVVNVKAGTVTTDAANVGQLPGTISGNVVTMGNPLAPGGGSGAVVVTNVAAGTVSAGSTDAVNGAQLHTTNTAVAGNTTAIAGLTTGLNSGTIGLVQQAGSAPGAGAITIGATTGGSAVSVAGTDGDRQLKHVAAGTDDADAANVGQLKAIGTTAANSVQYDDVGRSRVTLGGTSAAGPVALGNVAAGTLSASSTEAVNGAQLHATNTAVAGNTTAIAGNAASIASLTTGLNNGTLGLVQQAGSAPGAGAITIGATTGGSAVSVAGTDGDRQLKHVAAGTDDTDAANVGQLRAISAIAGSGVQYDDAGRSSVTLGGLAATAAVRLTNVAPGALNATSSDAVTGAQLYATNLAVEQNKTAITNLSNTVADIKGSTSNPTTPGQPGGAVQVPESLRQFTSNSSGTAASATGSEAIAIGAGAQASGKAAVAVGANSNAAGNGSVALGQGSVALGDNTVSVGNSAAGLTRTITNVSAGVAPTDAVNVRQLNESINSVRAQIEHDRADANGGTASAVAIASLPQAPAPGKSVVSVGGGTYAGQSAVAVGMSTYAGRWIVKASGSTNTRGTVAAGLGAGFVW